MGTSTSIATDLAEFRIEGGRRLQPIDLCRLTVSTNLGQWTLPKCRLAMGCAGTANMLREMSKM